MARGKQNITSMSVEDLISLRDNIRLVLRQKTDELREQLERLEIDGSGSSRGKARRGVGQKLPPKYRDPENRSNVWAGRGAIPMDGRENQRRRQPGGFSDWVLRRCYSQKTSWKESSEVRQGKGEEKSSAGS